MYRFSLIIFRHRQTSKILAHSVAERIVIRSNLIFSFKENSHAPSAILRGIEYPALFSWSVRYAFLFDPDCYPKLVVNDLLRQENVCIMFFSNQNGRIL